jgi:hypothetical protein
MSRNTKKGGQLNFFTYFDKSENAFVGVCIELAIIKESVNEAKLKRDLVSAAAGYVENVCKHGLSEDLLNQEPPEEYMKIFHRFISTLENKPVQTSKTVDYSLAAVFSRPVAQTC